MPSSVIHGMRFEPPKRVLDIVFRHGRGTYRYYDVSEEEWGAFKQSPSKGTYLNTTFRTAKHRFEKLADPLALVAGADEAVPAAQKDVPDANVWGFYETVL